MMNAHKCVLSLSSPSLLKAYFSSEEYNIKFNNIMLYLFQTRNNRALLKFCIFFKIDLAPTRLPKTTDLANLTYVSTCL